MESNDLTIIFLTLNRVPEKWAGYQLRKLKEAAGDYPIISVSKVPMNFGTNIIQEEEPSVQNIYWQMLRAAKMATTPYVAIAEDDTLYPWEHFHSFRPPLDTFAYNWIRWQLHTFDIPTFYWRKKLANYSMIAPRELLIEALEERFDKYPMGSPGSGAGSGELGRPLIERRLRVKVQKAVEFPTTIGIVCLHHDNGMDPLERNHKKRRGFLRATEIPGWGRAEDILKRFV